MKLKRILATAAATVVAVSSLAVVANADIYQPTAEDGEIDPGLKVGNGSWLIQVYNEGNEAEGKPKTDYGIDPTKVVTAKFYGEIVLAPDAPEKIKLEDFDFSGQMDTFGGAIIFSENGGELGKSEKESPAYEPTAKEKELGKTWTNLWQKYNWNQDPNGQWWGFPLPGDSKEGQEAGTNQGSADYLEKPIAMKYLSDFHYSIERTLSSDPEFDERYIPGGGCYQIQFSEWGGDTIFNFKVNLCLLKDENDEIVLAFDSLGKKLDNAEAKKLAEDYDNPKQPEGSKAPETTPASETTPAPKTTAAPVVTTAAPAPSTSSTTPVGVIIGIIAAVVAVIVVVVIIVIKKKK